MISFERQHLRNSTLRRCWVFTERDPGYSVGKICSSSSFYPRNRRSEIPPHPRIEGSRD